MPEDLLRRYRPAGPAADLRTRLLVPERAAWPWALAAAALLVMTVGLHGATRSLAKRAVDPGADAFVFDSRVTLLSETLGGGEDAKDRGVLLVMEEEFERRLPRPGALPPSEVIR